LWWTRSSRMRTAPGSTAPAWGYDDVLRIQDDSSAGKRWTMSFSSTTRVLSMSNGVNRLSMAQVTQADCDAIAAKAERTAEEAPRLQDPGGLLCTGPVGESVRDAGVALQT
jgi:hypothetical protein